MENLMSNLSFEKIEQSINDRKKLHMKFLDNVKTYKPFLELEEKAFAGGSLNRKTKELMALSISIVTKCEPCMEWHLAMGVKGPFK
jgi:alkylhydroperoxidase/carboxymuconolactone decarboxylase family protein YurZ